MGLRLVQHREWMTWEDLRAASTQGEVTERRNQAYCRYMWWENKRHGHELGLGSLTEHKEKKIDPYNNSKAVEQGSKGHTLSPSLQVFKPHLGKAMSNLV